MHTYRNLAIFIEATGLDYTILRPDYFTSANEVHYEITTEAAISRTSIAHFIAEIINTSDKYNG